MSFLSTLIGLAGLHSQHNAGQVTQQSHPQVQAPAQSPTGMTNLSGTQAYAPRPQGTSPLLNQLAVRQNYVAPLQNYNDGVPSFSGFMGSPDYQSDPQGGFGPQVQQLGMGGQYQGIQPAPFNQGPQNLGHMNPQVKDNGYYWYQ